MKANKDQSEITRHSTSFMEDFFPQAGVFASSHANISRRAYEIYVEKGFIKDQCKHNWHQAECELLKNA